MKVVPNLCEDNFLFKRVKDATRGSSIYLGSSLDEQELIGGGCEGNR